MDKPTKGRLFGIGVGPGDPKLITVLALETLRRVSVIFAASSPKNSYSRAYDVVKGYLNPDVEIRVLNFPMTKCRNTCSQAWKRNAREVLDVLDRGADAAFITIGDPLTYSTYGYLIEVIKEIDPQTSIVTVPGITSYNAAAARLNLPLVESKESLLVLSGVGDPEKIPGMVELGRNVVILKTYRDFDSIVDQLERMNPKVKTFAVSNCGMAEEFIYENVVALKGKKMPYLSMIIVKTQNPRNDYEPKRKP